MKEKCRATVSRLTPYLDAALPVPDREEVARHLEACPPCQVSAAKEEGGRAVLRERAAQLRAEAVPPALRSKCAAIADRARTRAKGGR